MNDEGGIQLDEADHHNAHRPQSVVRELQKRRRTLPRWECAEVTYHVRASVLPERCETLTDPEVGQIVRETLHYDDGRRYDLNCYVLMPDHFHALLYPLRRGDGSIPITEIMKVIKGVSARRINQVSEGHGSFWLDQSFTRIIRCPDEFVKTYHYIRSSPVRAGYAELPEDWQWWWEQTD